MTKARRRAELSLREAERRLERPGIPRRGGRQKELIGAMDCSREAVRQADERLASLAGERRNLRSAPRLPAAPGRSSLEHDAKPLEYGLEPGIEI